MVYIEARVSMEHLIPACDVSISYLLNKLKTKFIKIENRFFHGNHEQAKLTDRNYDDVVACHNMSLEDSENFHKILTSKFQK